MKLGNVAIDGTKMMTNANAWRSMNYQKLSEREQHWRAEVARLLSHAQQTEREEDQRPEPGDRLPDELADAQSGSSGCNKRRQSWNKKHKPS